MNHGLKFSKHPRFTSLVGTEIFRHLNPEPNPGPMLCLTKWLHTCALWPMSSVVDGCWPDHVDGVTGCGLKPSRPPPQGSWAHYYKNKTILGDSCSKFQRQSNNTSVSKNTPQFQRWSSSLCRQHTNKYYLLKSINRSRRAPSITLTQKSVSVLVLVYMFIWWKTAIRYLDFKQIYFLD